MISTRQTSFEPGLYDFEILNIGRIIQLTSAKNASSDSIRYPNKARPFVTTIVAAWATSVRAELAKPGEWFPLLGSVGIAK